MFRLNRFVGIPAFAPTGPVHEVQLLEKLIQKKGSTLVKSVVVSVLSNLSGEDAVSKLPLAEDYTLESLINAGVPLRETSVVGNFSQSTLNETLDSLDNSFVEPSNNEEK